MLLEEPFANGDSPIHALDPRFRLVMAFFYSLVMALSTRFPVLLAGVGISLVLVLLAGLKPGAVLRRLFWLNGFVLFFWLVLPLTFTGEPWFDIGPLAFSRNGVILAAQITLKTNAILLALIALVATMRIATLGHALGRLGLPQKIVQLLLMTYRYIFVLQAEYLRLQRSAKIRGFKPGTNLHTYRTYAYLIGMLFVRAAARAERVHQAMRCRGFKGRFYSLQVFAKSDWNWAFGVGMSGVILALAVLNWTQVLT